MVVHKITELKKRKKRELCDTPNRFERYYQNKTHVVGFFQNVVSSGSLSDFLYFPECKNTLNLVLIVMVIDAVVSCLLVKRVMICLQWTIKLDRKKVKNGNEEWKRLNYYRKFCGDCDTEHVRHLRRASSVHLNKLLLASEQARVETVMLTLNNAK